MMYCFDTSAFINPWTKNYRITNFPDYWGKIDELINNGIILASMEVLKDIEKQDDDLLEWVRTKPNLFREINQNIEKALTEFILPRFPNIVDYKRDRSGADPWVIALAIVEKATVISEENRGKKKVPKIPDVCEALKIRHIRIADFIAEQGWIFRL